MNLESSSFRLRFSILNYIFIFLLYLINILNQSKYFYFILIIYSYYYIFIFLLRALKKKNGLIFIILLFMFLYLIPMKYPLLYNVLVSCHQKNLSNQMVVNLALLILFFFNTLFLYLKIPYISEIYRIKIIRNDILFWILIFIIIAIIIFGKSGQNIIQSGGYGSKGFYSSSINEYIIIFFLLSYIYYGNIKIHLYIIYFLAFIYCLKNLLFGGRVEIIMIILLFYSIKIQFELSFKKTIILSIIGIWIMYIFGNIRSNPYILITNEWYSAFIPFISKSNIVAITTNEGDVFWASSRLLLLINNGYLTFVDRFIAFFYFIISPFFKISKLPDLANLSTFRLDIYSSGGGGLAPIYFFAFLSLPGVYILARYLAYWFNRINAKNSSFKSTYIILLIATVPRWYAYNPIQIIKLCLIGSIFAYFISQINKIMLHYTFK